MRESMASRISPTKKSLSEKGPLRIRSEKYLNHIRGQTCLVCNQPGEAHHLTHAQPRAMGRKTGDQYCVPLCHTHHMEMHNSHLGEATWWAVHGIDPIEWAEREYETCKGFPVKTMEERLICQKMNGGRKGNS